MMDTITLIILLIPFTAVTFPNFFNQTFHFYNGHLLNKKRVFKVFEITYQEKKAGLYTPALIFPAGV
jgi:hypothetical protein